MVKKDWDKAAHGHQPVHDIRRLAYKIEEAAALTGVSRTRIYEELNAGRLIAKKIGRSTLIPHESLEEWLKCLQEYPSPASVHQTKQPGIKP
jgi:excisionase family DNA binding protein